MSEEKCYYEITISQYLTSQWVDLITMESDRPLDKDELFDNIAKLTSQIHAAETIFFHTEEVSVIFSKHNGPIRITWEG